MKKFSKYILACLIFPMLIQCRSETESPNYAQDILYLAIGGARCGDVASCFERFAGTADEGASLLVIDKNNRILHDREKGIIANIRHQIIFSGSKWVTAVVIQRAIQSGACNTGGALSLNSTTGSVLGWTTRNNITMRQLLAFTSGLNDPGGASGQEACIANLPNNATNTQKDACVNAIRDNTKQDPAGESFVYNSNHMAVAQRMAEVSCGKSWSQLYIDEVVTPLGMNSNSTRWVSGLGGDADGDGSLAGAYGLIISPREYSRIMLALLREGEGFNGSANVAGFLTPGRVAEILDDQSEGSRIGFSQFSAFGYEWKYGLGNWRYCSVPNDPAECDRDLISHSVGANGFFPWLDRNRGYFGIVSVNNLGRKSGITNLPPTGNSLFFAETIRPMIHRELDN